MDISVFRKFSVWYNTTRWIRRMMFVVFIIVVSVSCAQLAGVAGDRAVRSLVIDASTAIVRDVAGMHQEIGRLREAVSELHAAVHAIEDLLGDFDPTHDNEPSDG